MHTDQEPGITILFDHALNTMTIQFHVLFSRNGNVAVRNKRNGIHLGMDFPFGPSIVMFRSCQTKRLEGFRRGEKPVPPMAREKTRQHSVIGLANQNELVPLILDNHGTALRKCRRQHRPVRWSAGWIGDKQKAQLTNLSIM